MPEGVGERVWGRYSHHIPLWSMGSVVSFLAASGAEATRQNEFGAF